MADRDRAIDPRFLIASGSGPVDPKAESSKARQRVTAGRRKLAKALGIEVAGLPGADREAWIVQLTDDPDPETVRRVHDDYGLQLTQRISSLAFVERMDRETAAKVRRDPAVRASVPYPPDLKVQTAGPTVSVAGSRLEIGLIEGDDLPAVSGMLEALGVNVVFASDDTHAGADFSLLVETTQSTDLSIVATIDDIAWIAEVGQLALDNFDTAGVAQSGEAMSHPLWDKDLHGEDMIIGVIDSPDIDVNSTYFLDVDGSPVGIPAHRKIVDYRNVGPPNLTGTHPTRVCGCVAGDAAGNLGADPHRGGAWAAKIAYSDGARFFGTHIQSTLVAELSAALNAGARVHSNSWHRATKSITPMRYDHMAAAIDGFLWNNEDHLFVTSAQNPGLLTAEPEQPNGPKHVTFPAGPPLSKNAITVGGVNASPNQNVRRDDLLPVTADGRRKPDLLAVADGVITSDRTVDPAKPLIAPNPFAVTDGIGGNADPTDGNSFATPHVAAAAALVRQYFIEGWYPNGKKEGKRRKITPSGALLKAMLLNATVPLTVPYPSQRDGWGRLELHRTLHFDGDKLRLWIQDVRRSVGLLRTGRADPFSLTVPANARSMRITLVFNDRKGVVREGEEVVRPGEDPVVNKLEIEVMEPNPSNFGYFGNNFDPAFGLVPRRPRSLRRDFTDRLHLLPDPAELRNNVRQVIVDKPTAGRWTIVVRAHWIDQAPLKPLPSLNSQGYALVASIELT